MVTDTVLSLNAIRTDGGNLGSKPQVQSEIQPGEQFPGNEHLIRKKLRRRLRKSAGLCLWNLSPIRSRGGADLGGAQLARTKQTCLTSSANAKKDSYLFHVFGFLWICGCPLLR